MSKLLFPKKEKRLRFVYPCANKRLLPWKNRDFMPILHLPRAPCDYYKRFWGIVGVYGQRRICLHGLRALCSLSGGKPRPRQPRTEAARRLYGNVQFQCSCRAVCAATVRKSDGVRAASVQSAPRWCVDHATAVLFLSVESPVYKKRSRVITFQNVIF